MAGNESLMDELLKLNSDEDDTEVNEDYSNSEFDGDDDEDDGYGDFFGDDDEDEVYSESDNSIDFDDDDESSAISIEDDEEDTSDEEDTYDEAEDEAYGEDDDNIETDEYADEEDEENDDVSGEDEITVEYAEEDESIDLFGYDEEDEESDESVEEIAENSEEIEYEPELTLSTSIDLINDSGELVVQEPDDGQRFKLEYIPFDKIAVTSRIRKSRNVESLTKSIKSTGLLKPPIVAPLATDGYYVLIDGLRRLLACAKSGMQKIPCVINTKIKSQDVSVLEALHNHSTGYTMKEIVSYIEYLEKEQGILNATMIEYLLQLDSGDYSKLKDILTDNDDEIVNALMNGQMTIAQAFKKLEQRRKKETKEEKENKKAEKVYEDTEESGVGRIEGAGEEGDDEVTLSDEEIESLGISGEELASVENESLDAMVETGKGIDGFESHKQDYKHRERLDPALRKAVLARDKNTCQCCGLEGQEYLEVFDVHHKVEVYLGGSDDIDNLITVCVCCHKLIHLWGRGELHVRPESELTEEDKIKFKKIVKLGNKIREGMAMKGMKREELKKVDNADTIGRTKPGTERQIAT